MRVCIAYDHIFPATGGGGERWLHDVAVAVAAAGHDVTYLTMRHWDDASRAPSLAGVRVEALVPAGQVYAGERRRFGPPLRFGAAVARHLALHGRDYDVVHTAAFPYFPLLAAAGLRRRGRYRLVVDWFEAWTAAYWRRYAGMLGGTAGWAIQRACLAVPQVALCISGHTATRLRALGMRGQIAVMPTLFAGESMPTPIDDVEPLVVFAGRHVREKRIPELVRGFEVARARRPDLRLEVYGSGPDTRTVEATVTALGLEASATVHGLRPPEEVDAAFARASCVATASEREGYGLVVVEAAAKGTPAVIVAGAENAATSLVAEGRNGAVAADASAEQIGAALLRVLDGGSALRAQTLAWFDEHTADAGFERTIEAVLAAYGAPAARVATR